MFLVRYLVVLALLQPVDQLLADTVEGRVVSVGSGDTLTIVDGASVRFKIRLVGIDAPESEQPFGAESKKHLSDLVLNREVTIVGKTQDSFGRDMGKVMLADPNCNHSACPKIHDAGMMQLMAGMAWWFRGYPREQSDEDRGYYEFAEFEAKIKRTGLWQDPSPVPPWEWRKSNTKSWISRKPVTKNVDS